MALRGSIRLQDVVHEHSGWEFLGVLNAHDSKVFFVCVCDFFVVGCGGESILTIDFCFLGGMNIPFTLALFFGGYSG